MAKNFINFSITKICNELNKLQNKIYSKINGNFLLTILHNFHNFHSFIHFKSLWVLGRYICQSFITSIKFAPNCKIKPTDMCLSCSENAKQTSKSHKRAFAFYQASHLKTHPTSNSKRKQIFITAAPTDI